jgi:hypothetical protein
MKQKESGQKDASSSCKLNCQNGKSKSGWQHKKTQDKRSIIFLRIIWQR